MLTNEVSFDKISIYFLNVSLNVKLQTVFISERNFLEIGTKSLKIKNENCQAQAQTQD